MGGYCDCTPSSVFCGMMPCPTREESHQCAHRAFQQPIEHIERFPLSGGQSWGCDPSLPHKAAGAQYDQPAQYADYEVVVHTSASLPAEQQLFSAGRERRIERYPLIASPARPPTNITIPTVTITDNNVKTKMSSTISPPIGLCILTNAFYFGNTLMSHTFSSRQIEPTMNTWMPATRTRWALETGSIPR